MLIGPGAGAGGRIEDFHALMVLNALFGGLFDSRLNRLLREERGYTYGVHSDFDMRRGAGPFSVRCAVEMAVTAPDDATFTYLAGRPFAPAGQEWMPPPQQVHSEPSIAQ